MSYGQQSADHQNALRQINDARQRALNAVSEIRQVDVNTPHKNLAAVPNDGSRSTPIVCSQYVVDYLIQLHPYRKNSQNWNIDFGTVELPEKIEGGRMSKRRGKDRVVTLHCCHDPKISVSNATELINATNMDILYSSNRPHIDDTVDDSRTHTVRTASHGELEFEDIEQAMAVAHGTITPSEAIETGMVKNATTDKDGGYIPAHPWRASQYDQVKAFKLIFSPDRLLQIVEIADEIAAEMDMLADIKTPDYEAGGGGAV